jgi:hypothetical protein
MPTDKLHPSLAALCGSLDSLATKVVEGWSSDQTLMANWGWNFPPINRHGLGRAASEIATALRNIGSEIPDDPMLKTVTGWTANIEALKNNTVPHFYDGNGSVAVPVYLAALSRLRAELEPFLGWQALQDSNLIPAKIARRVRAYQAELDQIAPNKDELKRQITLINEATTASESLPTDLEALAAARKKIEKLENDSLLLHQKIAESLGKSEVASDQIKSYQGETEKLVAQCEEAYRITTTKGLAAAFDQRATSLGKSMWIWVVGLIVALGVGCFFGAERVKALTAILNSQTQEKGVIWLNAVLMFLSLGAPIWLAWIATKQIGQRFRLAEDYAFKASVAKAYEGYRKEAARIDKAFEARLFASALTRLEEAPLRLVEGKTPGSPWHEFLESEAFSEALRTVPGLLEKYKRARKKNPKSEPSSDGTEDAAEIKEKPGKR